LTAVEAANLLWAPLRRGDVEIRHLARVQRRRELAVRITQAFQAIMQQWIVAPNLADVRTEPSVPLILRVATRVPVIKNLPAQIVGWGCGGRGYAHSRSRRTTETVDEITPVQ
jgi:hypothetical protein